MHGMAQQQLQPCLHSMDDVFAFFGRDVALPERKRHDHGGQVVEHLVFKLPVAANEPWTVLARTVPRLPIITLQTCTRNIGV